MSTTMNLTPFRTARFPKLPNLSRGSSLISMDSTEQIRALQQYLEANPIQPVRYSRPSSETRSSERNSSAA